MNKYWDEIAPISLTLPLEGAKEAAQWLREVYLEGQLLVNDSLVAAGLGRLYRDALVGLATHRYDIVPQSLWQSFAKLVISKRVKTGTIVDINLKLNIRRCCISSPYFFSFFGHVIKKKPLRNTANGIS